MKFLKQISVLALTLSVLNCASSDTKLQSKAPTTFENVYYQKWNAGVQGAGSGITLFIQTKDNSVVLDTVYFRGKAAQLETKPNTKNLYIGRFKTTTNAPKDIILSQNLDEEIKNEIEIEAPKFPFILNANECVVSYKLNAKKMYFKITNIKEQETVNYPSARPNRQ
mgnify:CR=1 FL=1